MLQIIINYQSCPYDVNLYIYLNEQKFIIVNLYDVLPFSFTPISFSKTTKLNEGIRDTYSSYPT